MTSLYYYLINGSIFSPILVVFVFLWVQKSKYNKIDWIILSYALLSFSCDLISKFVIQGNNYWFLSIYNFMDMLVIAYFYTYLLRDRKKLIFTIVGIFILVFSIDYLLYGTFLEFFRYSFTFRVFATMILALSYFYQIFTQEDDIFLEKATVFWYNVALLVYSAGAFFTFLLSTELLSGLFPKSWYLHNFSNILKNIILAVGLWRVQKR